IDAEFVHYAARARVPRAPVDGDVQQMPIGALPRFDLDQSGWDDVPAAWAQLELLATPRLHVTPGVRVDWFQFVDQLTIDPRLSARYQWDDQTALRAAAGLFHEQPPPQYTAPVIG